MDILGTIKQTVDLLTGEEARRQEREREALKERAEQQEREKEASAKRFAEKLAAEQAQVKQVAGDRENAEQERKKKQGPMERLWEGKLPPPLPGPQDTRKAQPPTRLEHTLVPGMGPTIAKPGIRYKDSHVQEPEAQPVREDIYDRTMKRKIDAQKLEEHRRSKLTQPERDAEDERKKADDLLKQLEQGRRGTLTQSYETGLSMTRVRE